MEHSISFVRVYETMVPLFTHRIFTACQQGNGFTFVYLTFCLRERSPMWPDCTVTPLDMRLHCVLVPLLVASDGHHKISVKTCSVQDTCTVGVRRQCALLQCFIVSSINQSHSCMVFVTNTMSLDINWMPHLAPERSFQIILLNEGPQMTTRVLSSKRYLFSIH